MNEILGYLMKLGISMLLGLFIGYEREQQNKPAGMRDVMLVTLGATVFTLVALETIKIGLQYQPPIRYDFGRIIAYTIVSMGFLGSGVILRSKGSIEGITTASLLWVMVGVGLFCGIGNFVLAIITSIFIYLILKLKYFKIKFETRRKNGRRRKSISS